MRTSSVKRQPPEILELIGKLRAAGKTIDEILAKLQELELEQPVSRTALGRHIKEIDGIREHIGKSRTIAQALIEKLGDGPDMRTARLNIELLHSMILKLLVTEEGQVLEIDGKAAFFLAKTLKDLAAASKSDADREKVIRDAIQKEAKKKIDQLGAAMGKAEAAGKPLSRKDILKKLHEAYGIEA
ncbi:MAG: phage protein Gp27 family protein [Alphaproteobacteria bacterium]